MRTLIRLILLVALIPTLLIAQGINKIFTMGNVCWESVLTGPMCATGIAVGENLILSVQAQKSLPAINGSRAKEAIVDPDFPRLVIYRTETGIRKLLEASDFKDLDNPGGLVSMFGVIGNRPMFMLGTASPAGKGFISVTSNLAGTGWLVVSMNRECIGMVVEIRVTNVGFQSHVVSGSVIAEFLKKHLPPSPQKERPYGVTKSYVDE